MNIDEKLKMYLSLLKIYADCTQMVHWKNIGAGFHTAHPRYGEYYGELIEFMDQTAEQMITLGLNPVSYPEALAIVRDSDDVHGIMVTSDMNFTESSGDTVCLNMFNQLYELAESLADDDDLPVDVQDVFMSHAKWYRIEGKYKIARNLKASTTTPAPTVTEEPSPELNVEDEDND